MLVRVRETMVSRSEELYDELHKQSGFAEEYEYYRLVAVLIQGKRSLDIGCGSGWLEKYSPETVAVDFSEEALRLARQNGARRTVKAEADNLPFADDEFEVAVSLGVLEHCLYQEQAVAEMVRVSQVQIMAVHARLPYGLEFLRNPALRIFGLRDQPVEKPLSLAQVKSLLLRVGARPIVEGVWNYVDLRWLHPKLPYGVVKWPSHHFVISLKTDNLERRFLGRR